MSKVDVSKIGLRKIRVQETVPIIDPETGKQAVNEVGSPAYEVKFSFKTERSSHLTDDEAKLLVGAKWEERPPEFKTCPKYVTYYEGYRFYCDNPPKDEPKPEPKPKSKKKNDKADTKGA